ncbi:hypothetical protein RhiirA5_421430 [Rhizophagus irregularis]|uniref:CCHC-type domain-containing protein n=1 Tax=Rhizophagus irregularis TaxID=588596 RepID=A0A2N0PE02_9GLOM|nr:hypothetical protein RhiirA5_421430 [Rhizophagus irregularis]
MSDSESISSDGSNDAIFQNDFIESIPDDSDSSKSEDDVYDMNVSPLRRLLLNILNFGLINKAFLFAKEGLKKYNLGEENRQVPNSSELNDNPYISLSNQRLYYVSVHGLTKKASQIAKIDQENVGQIGNPIIRRPKGRPPGTARFKRPLEASNEGNKSRKCDLCNESGHNRTTCPVNTNRRKERMMIR